MLLRTRLLASTAPAATDSALAAAPLDASALLLKKAEISIKSCAVTATSPAALTWLVLMKARVSSGNTVKPTSVPIRLLSAAAAMLPMSQPTALNASEAPPADPADSVTELPAVDVASTLVALRACTRSTPVLLTVLPCRLALTPPSNWFQAKVPASEIDMSAAPSASPPVTAMDSVPAVTEALLLASRYSAPASSLLSSTRAWVVRLIVLLADATPICTLLSRGTAAEKPPLWASKLAWSRATTMTSPIAPMSALSSSACTLPLAMLRATLADALSLTAFKARTCSPSTFRLAPCTRAST